jgi:hypothetical protein
VTGELTSARFGAGTDDVLAWLSGLQAPVRAVHEAGRTGFVLYRRGACTAGIENRGDRAEQDGRAVR